MDHYILLVLCRTFLSDLGLARMNIFEDFLVIWCVIGLIYYFTTMPRFAPSTLHWIVAMLIAGPASWIFGVVVGLALAILDSRSHK